LRLLQNGPKAQLRGISIAFALAVTAILPATALGAGGGFSPTAASEKGVPATPTTITPGSTECTTSPEGIRTCLPVPPAELVSGAAVFPTTAPGAVKAAVYSANLIRTKPYVWGGGHARWWMSGYDCSGAVSFALHGAGFLTVPMDSGEMTTWGVPGKGRWITVYANAGHAFAVIDGLRWDTAGDSSGTGPRWHSDMTSTAGFVVRHPAGY
jgi:cell wall-associated NlpC family hydrolase